MKFAFKMNANLLALLLVGLFVLFLLFEFVISLLSPKPPPKTAFTYGDIEQVEEITGSRFTDEEKRLLAEDPMNLFKIPRYKEMLDMAKEFEQQEHGK